MRSRAIVRCALFAAFSVTSRAQRTPSGEQFFPNVASPSPGTTFSLAPAAAAACPAYGVRGLGRGLQPERRRVLRRVLRPPGGRGARAVLLRRQYRRHRGGCHRRGGSGLLPRLRRATVRRDAHRGERVPLLLPPPTPPRASASPSPTRRRPRLRTTTASRTPQTRPPDAARDATTTNPDPVPDPLAPPPRLPPSSRRRPRRSPRPRGVPGFSPNPSRPTLVPRFPNLPSDPVPRRSSRSLHRRRRPSGRRLAPRPSPSRRKIPGLPTAAELLSGKGWVNREVGFFADALVATGLLGLLASPGPFTVFAPSNRAWYRALSALGATKEDVFEDPALTEVMLYHVARGETYTSGMFSGRRCQPCTRPRRASRGRCETRWPRAETPRARTSRSRKDSRWRCFRRSFERRISSTGAT